MGIETDSQIIQANNTAAYDNRGSDVEANYNNNTTAIDETNNEAIQQAQEEDEEEEDAYYENPMEVIREFGNHPLMERAQNALNQELKDNNYRLSIGLKDKKDELRNFTQEREALGVQLYSLQQQLARIQLTLENAHNEHNRLVDTRLAEEEILRDVNKNNTEQLALMEEYKKQQKKHSQELDALSETIRQIEQYNDQVKSEIAISRRATYKVEQNMQDLEKVKENQDYYVDVLGKQIKALEEQVVFITQQYEVQKRDTSDATSVIQETVKELELIGTEKQQLMIQWKAALSGLSRRDEALAQATQTLAVAESSVHDYDVEIEAARRELQREQAKHESLVSLRDRLENELAWVEENVAKIALERQQLQERYTLLSKSLAQTDHENKKLELLTKQLDGESEQLIATIQAVLNERQALEDELQILYSTHANVKKAVSNLGKDASKVMQSIHEKEKDANELENAIARAKVEKLTIASTNDSLREQLAGLVKELTEKETLVSKYQVEIRQRNDEIEKKMYRVDRLNKKYEKMIESAGGEENLGPLENTIKNLTKEVERLDGECKEFERDWLKKQTEMVNLSAECEGLQERNGEAQARVTVVSQQQLRYMKDLHSLQANSKVAVQVNGEYAKDISKLNAYIAANHDAEHTLQAQNFVVEMDCLEELKEAEREAVQLQVSIQENQNSKASLLDEIVEMERQAMLWEKKIALDNETKQALDPTVGVAENANMEKEIHRMDLRLEALKREQERLSIEMERAIQKRSTIAVRYSAGSASAGNMSASVKGASGLLGATSGKGSTGKVTSGGVNKELTQATAKKRIVALKKEARLLAEETSQYTSMFDEKRQGLEEMGVDLERMTAQYGEAEETCQSLQSNINELLYQKQLAQERIAYRQKYTSRLRELSQTGVDLGQALPVERKLLSSLQALENVKEILGELQMAFPHLHEVLQRVTAMTDPDLPLLTAVTE